MYRSRPILLLGLVLGGCQSAPAPGTAVRVEIAGGANPGVYETSGREISCAGPAAGAEGLGVQFTDWTGPKEGLRSLSLVLPSSQRPEDFYLGMVFGDFFAGRVIEIDTRAAAPAPRGKGRVTVAPAEGGTAVTVTGETENAVALTATILCLTPVALEGANP